MAAPYLAQLGLSDEEQRKLAAIGAETPQMLLGVYHASTEAFEHLLGVERAREVVEKLTQLVTPEERRRLAGQPRRFATGARLGKPPRDRS